MQYDRYTDIYIYIYSHHHNIFMATSVHLGTPMSGYMLLEFQHHTIQDIWNKNVDSKNAKNPKIPKNHIDIYL